MRSTIPHPLPGRSNIRSRETGTEGQALSTRAEVLLLARSLAASLTPGQELLHVPLPPQGGAAAFLVDAQQQVEERLQPRVASGPLARLRREQLPQSSQAPLHGAAHDPPLAEAAAVAVAAGSEAAVEGGGGDDGQPEPDLPPPAPEQERRSLAGPRLAVCGMGAT